MTVVLSERERAGVNLPATGGEVKGRRLFVKQSIVKFLSFRLSATEKKSLIQELYGTLKSFDQRDVLNRIKPAGSHLHRNPRRKEKEAA